MIKKTVLVGVVLIILFSIFFFRNKKEPMITPSVATPPPSAEINQPKEVKYDVATDLKKELDSVNPQVLDSDIL